MAITPLPEATIRQLGSSMTITTPATLVKELLDNAIDAKATSVTILISQNTVDRVEVSDNGNGIHPDDFESLGRPGYTSKLRSYEQLSTIGGSSLGFRGVALASANAMAKKISVTTRSPTDQHATTFDLSPAGGIEKCVPAAAPVGTIVRATELFAHHPVRLKTMVKRATATHREIKDLLLSYALARPELRLQLKEVNSSKAPWCYISEPNVDVQNAVLQCFGTELVSQCVWRTSEDMLAGAQFGDVEQVASPGYQDESWVMFEAFLPKHDADLTKISKGAFFSIDSRPVSSSYDTPKKLLAIYKLGVASAMRIAPAMLKHPFIRLNIRCSPRSYDPNVEPSKNRVLFHREEHILKAFREFISSTYPIAAGEQSEPTAIRDSRAGLGGTGNTECRAPQIMLDAQAGYPNSPGPASERKSSPPNSFATISLRQPGLSQQWTADMSTNLDQQIDDSDDREVLPKAPDDHTAAREPADYAQALREEPSDSVEALNPWTIAKLAAPRYRNESQAVVLRRDPTATSSSSLPNMAINHTDTGSLLRKTTSQPNEFRMPLRPQRSSCTGQPPFRPHTKARRGDHRTRNSAADGADKRRYERLDEGREPSLSRYALYPPGSSTNNRNKEFQDNRSQTGAGFDRRSLKRNHHRQPVAKHRQKLSAVLNPLGHDGGMTTLQCDHNNRQTITRRLDGSAQKRYQGDDIHPQPSNSRHLHRNPKEEAVSGDGSAAMCPGDTFVKSTPGPPPTKGDSRAYLMRRQRSIARNPQKSLKRLKTELLPLETTSSEFETRNLALIVSSEPHNLVRHLVAASRFDSYMIKGELGDGLSELASSKEAICVQDRVNAFLSWLVGAHHPKWDFSSGVLLEL